MKQFLGTFRGDPVDRVAGTQGCICLAVGDVVPESPRAQRDQFFAHGVVAEFTERNDGAPSAFWRLGEQVEGGLDVGGEDLVIGFETSTIAAAHDVCAVTTVVRLYFDAGVVLTDDAGEGQQAKRVLQCDVRGLHRAEERLGLRLVLVFTCFAELHVGAKTPLAQQHREA